MKVVAVAMLAMPLWAAPILAGCGAGIQIPKATANAKNGSSAAAGNASAGPGAGDAAHAGSFAHPVRSILDCSACFSSGDSATSIIQADAQAVNQIQSLTTWFAATDTSGGGAGSATGSMQIVGTPSLSGAAREFSTTFTDSGDERYAVSFGVDTESTHFFYDGWVYLDSPSNDIANLEMDMNQVLSNGQTAIFGFQCDGYSGTWDYTENAGTPQAPVDQWVHSTAACNPRNWETGVWHHVQISCARDDAGNVTYNSVWLDGHEQALNVTVPSAFALGWESTLLTNFQVDGLGSGGSSTVYLDHLTISRW